jgi:MoxR-like ATPase
MRRMSRTEQNPIRSRIGRLIGSICSGMVEREETVAVALLAALCGQNAFLYGPPGTAKSLISRRIACAFQAPVYFEYLMNRFSTPEEVFGPVSIQALKEDRYLRKTEGYLPRADIAFLDEIWKSSPAILNTLLTLINERIFKNGGTVEPAPLRALLAASNETPAANQGLEALFDRFLVRLMVAPVSQLHHFEQLLNSKPSPAEVGVDETLRVRPDEWQEWLEQIHTVALSPETLQIVHLIRARLVEEHEAFGVYVSDRRWQRAAMFMKAAAFFNGRKETNHSDALLLQHCLWTHKDNYEALAEIVADAVESTGIESGLSLDEIERTKNSLEREINNELYYSSDVYKTETAKNGKEVFKAAVPDTFRYWNRNNWGSFLFLPYSALKSKDVFHPLDVSGNEIDSVECQFDGQGTCKLTESRYRNSAFYEPTVLFHKGDKKDNVNDRLIASLSTSLSETKATLRSALEEIRVQRTEREAQLASLFVPMHKTNLAIAGILAQIEGLELRIKDCERLEALCR